MKVKKIPMRMCVGCRQMLPKKSMIRIVRQQDGTIHLDTTGKAAGRGAYICRGEQCLKVINGAGFVLQGCSNILCRVYGCIVGIHV